jgi:signal transduction histidine kinase
VELGLAREGTSLKVTIRDNGRGFDPHLPPTRKSKKPRMGLVDMKERAAFLGGTCALRSASGQGTEVVIEVPVPTPGKSRL